MYKNDSVAPMHQNKNTDPINILIRDLRNKNTLFIHVCIYNNLLYIQIYMKQGRLVIQDLLIQ